MKNFFNFAFLDAPEAWQILLQDPATPAMEGIISFHDDVMFILVLIVVFVLYLLVEIVNNYNSEVHPTPEKFVHGTLIEIIWTLTPAAILMVIAVPSFALLYSMDEIIDPAYTVKVIGHQWYWHYEYSDFVTFDKIKQNISFESYMIPTKSLTFGSLRNLEVDNRVVIPSRTNIRFIVTAADVLHSWAIPSLGLKIDACPGRLNMVTCHALRNGVYYGQCSEICGINHAFMPIVVESVSHDDFIRWVYNKVS